MSPANAGGWLCPGGTGSGPCSLHAGGGGASRAPSGLGCRPAAARAALTAAEDRPAEIGACSRARKAVRARLGGVTAAPPVMPPAVSKPGGPPNLGRSSDKQGAGMPFSTMDQNFPKYAMASDGVGGSSAFPTQQDRWSGYEEIDVPERERGWMPRQRSTLDTQRRARQKKNQHNVVVGSKV